MVHLHEGEYYSSQAEIKAGGIEVCPRQRDMVLFCSHGGGVNDKGNSTRRHGKNAISQSLFIVRSVMKE